MPLSQSIRLLSCRFTAQRAFGSTAPRNPGHFVVADTLPIPACCISSKFAILPIAPRPDAFSLCVFGLLGSRPTAHHPIDWNFHLQCCAASLICFACEDYCKQGSRLRLLLGALVPSTGPPLLKK
jgi:hypothetical protein